MWGLNQGVYFGFAADPVDPIPLRYVGDRHLLTLGPNGSGKSMRLLLPNLVDLVDWSILVVDPKGELASMTLAHRSGHNVVVINPFGVNDLPSDGFNPLALLDPESDEFVDDAMGLAEALISVQGNEPHWSQSAQDLVCALIMYSRLAADEETTPGLDDDDNFVELPWPKDEEERGTLGHVRVLLGKPVKKLRSVAYKAYDLALARDCPELANKIGRFLDIDPENKELNSILSTALTQTRWIDSRPVRKDLAGDSFDFSDMKKVPTTVYLILPPRRLGTHGTWLRVIITSVLQQLLKDTSTAGVPCLFMLDEAAQLGYLPAIEKNLAIMRGYGVKLWSVYQDLSQLQEIYGKRWESFAANAGVLQSFAPQDVTTSNYLSERTGMTSVEDWTFGGGLGPDAEPGDGNMSFKKMSVPLMRPEELRDMPDGHGIIFTNKVPGTIKQFVPYPTLLPHVNEVMNQASGEGEPSNFFKPPLSPFSWLRLTPKKPKTSRSVHEELRQHGTPDLVATPHSAGMNAQAEIKRPSRKRRIENR